MDAPPISADVVVVGLGLIGSGALRSLADHAAAADERVIGVGTSEPAVRADHDGPFASHYDSGRITRRLDATLEWAVLASRAIDAYADLEARSGVTFHRPTGLVLAELDPHRVAAVAAVADALAVPTGHVGPDNGRAHPLLTLPAGSTAFTEGPPAGHIDPRRVRRSNLAVAAAAGATVVDAEVTAVVATPAGWRVRATDGTVVDAARVLVAAGAHSDELGLPRCPAFTVRGETVVMAVLDDAEAGRLASMPSVIAALDDPTYADLYVVPPTDYPDGTVRLKLGATLRHERHLDDGAARRAWMRGDDHLAELPALRRLLEDLVPGLRAERWETSACLITDTASGLPVVDHLAPGLVLAAGGNGYAAKSANAIGDLAARLLVSGTWPDDELDASRFAAI